MELSPETAGKIISGAWGLLSFIALIVYLRGVRTRDEDQQKPFEMTKENERQSEKS